jgi:hypothetical protein
MGLPCAHRIFDLLKRNQAIPLSDIHPFWRIDLDQGDSDYRPILEPMIPLPKPKKRKRDEAQAAEIIGEPVQKKKAPPKCSTCGEVGHTRRSCK